MGKITLVILLGLVFEPTFADTVEIRVPKSYVGYTLRIHGENHELKGDKQNVVTDGTRERIVIKDRSNKVVSTSVTHIDKALLRNQTRRFHVGAAVGGLTGGNRFEGLMSHNSIFSAEASAVYRGEYVGFDLAIGYAGGDETKGLARAHYHQDSVRAGLLYEFVPLQFGPEFFQRFHLGLSAGALGIKHYYSIEESPVKISDSYKSIAPYAALDVRYPIAVNIWLTLRNQYSRQRIKFQNLKFDENVDTYNTTFGVHYAL